MNIINFVKGLLPRLTKDQLQEDIRVTLAELEQIGMTNFRQAGEYFRSAKVKSDDAKSMSDIFYRNFDLQGTSRQNNFISEIAFRLPMVKDNLEYIRDQVESIMEADIMHDGLTAKKAIMVRAAEGISYISRYSTDLLNYVYVAEAINANAEVEESLRLSPAATKHVQNNIAKFARLISDYGIPTKTFSKLLSSVPEVIVNSANANSIKGMYSEQDVDPFQSSFLQGFIGNPLYHIRLNIAEWQAGRYKANKDKKKMLELRLLHLKLINEKKNDPKIEEEITYIQGRVDKIERYLREVEESVELEG